MILIFLCILFFAQTSFANSTKPVWIWKVDFLRVKLFTFVYPVPVLWSLRLYSYDLSFMFGRKFHKQRDREFFWWCFSGFFELFYEGQEIHFEGRNERNPSSKINFPWIVLEFSSKYFHLFTSLLFLPFSSIFTSYFPL